jgi:hypothetical protein
MRNRNGAITAVWLGALSILILLSAGTTEAGPPTQGPEGEDAGIQAMMDDGFWYQGRLTDGGGNLLANAHFNATFRIYDVFYGGTALDSVGVAFYTDENGLFNHEIDFNNPDLFDGRALWLGLQVSGEASEMTPRQYLRPVPYAMSVRPGAVISTGSTLSAYDPVLEIRHTVSSTADLDGLHAYVESDGEAIEGYSQYGKGVYGHTYADGTSGDAGVYGDSHGDSPGVRGHSNGTDSNYAYGGYFTSQNRRGLYAQGGLNYYAAYIWGSGPNAPGIYVRGNIYATGSSLSSGTKSAVMEAGDYGVRQLYAMESPNVWFEDFGTGELASGQATVVIEPMFLSTINTDVPYHVFVTPLGECNGLYVTNKAATSFEVRELGGGTSDVAFDYRIVARRKGYEGVRMELATGEGGKLLEAFPPAPPREPEREEP